MGSIFSPKQKDVKPPKPDDDLISLRKRIAGRGGNQSTIASKGVAQSGGVFNKSNLGGTK